MNHHSPKRNWLSHTPNLHIAKRIVVAVMTLFVLLFALYPKG